jgi:hypothetical protein
MTSPVDYSPPNSPPGSAGNENHVVDGQRLGLLPNQGRPAIPISWAFKPAVVDFPLPATADHISSVPAWNLGANNQYGTCGPTSLANYITMVYWNLLGQQVVVTDQAIFNLYAASGNAGFPPSPDNGVDLNFMLTQALDVGLEVAYTGVTNPAVFKSGVWLSPIAGAKELVKPVAFGALAVEDLQDIKFATAIFGGAILGVTLQVSQQSQTANSLWDFSQSPIWGGHAIMGGAYSGNTSGPDEVIISWAKPIETTDLFINNQLSQAYAVVLPCHLSHPAFLQGVDVSKLAELYQELTGRPFPA